VSNFVPRPHQHNASITIGRSPLFSKAKLSPDNSPHRHARRQRAPFAKSLTNPTLPYVVGDKIREIVNGDSWQLRYPVGPDAVPFDFRK
jgi:hypothetical protein